MEPGTGEYCQYCEDFYFDEEDAYGGEVASLEDYIENQEGEETNVDRVVNISQMPGDPKEGDQARDKPEKWYNQRMTWARREYVLELLEELTKAIREDDSLSVEDVRDRLDFISGRIGERYVVVEVPDPEKSGFFIWDSVTRESGAPEFSSIEEAEAEATRLNKEDREEIAE